MASTNGVPGSRIGHACIKLPEAESGFLRPQSLELWRAIFRATLFLYQRAWCVQFIVHFYTLSGKLDFVQKLRSSAVWPLGRDPRCLSLLTFGFFAQQFRVGLAGHL